MRGQEFRCVKRFSDTEDGQLLYRFSSKRVSATSGETGRNPGHDTMGDFPVDILAEGQDLNGFIVDISRRRSASAQVPYYHWGEK